MWRMLDWWNVAPNASEATVWRMTRAQKSITLAQRVRRWPQKSIFLNASDVTEERLNQFIRQFNAIRPAVLKGYLGAIEHLARYIEENRLRIASPSIVWVTSAPVSKVQRALLKNVFRAPVVDQYGCCEIFWLAAECPQSNGALHFFYDLRHIEFVDDEGTEPPSGTDGRVLLTDLCNYTFPLIRYENGDRGRWMNPRRCACGNGLPLIDSIKGRVTDSIALPNGAYVSGDALTTLFDDFPDAVRQFQVCFKAKKRLILRIVPNADNPHSETQIKEVQKRLELMAAGVVEVSLERLPEIPHDRGKTRYVVNED
jgi:phenylacetate-CoA ligase